MWPSHSSGAAVTDCTRLTADWTHMARVVTQTSQSYALTVHHILSVHAKAPKSYMLTVTADAYATPCAQVGKQHVCTGYDSL